MLELKDWFLKKECGGLAIVCGSISNLAVLDFDDENLAILFESLHPDLAQTQVVRSGGRGLPHYYYHIPSHLENVRSRAVPGVDWQYDGRYVIAPPTQGESGKWETIRDTAPKILTERDLSRIMAFMDAIPRNALKNGSEGVVEQSGPSPVVVDDLFPGLSPRHIVNYYRARVHQGRNNALFWTCCWLRDNGGTVDDAMPLVNVHAQEPPIGPHPPETPQQRRDEALRTILSAFSRPSGVQRKRRYNQIPNSLREAMLRRGQTAALRVLEAMIKAGWRTGKVFSRKELAAVASQYEIGDWSVRKAIEATCPEDELIFGGSATGAIAATNTGDISPQLNAIELSETKPTKNRGRPANAYTMPDLEALCVRYDVRWTWGDVLSEADLGGVAAYRKALHEAFLQRAPGQYYRGWMAARLGISKRTLDRYNGALNVISTPMYRSRWITWKTLGELPEDLKEHPYGAFLEDETGKRYPPLLPIARKLLRAKKIVTYKLRLANHYRIPTPQPDTQPQPEVDAPAPRFPMSEAQKAALLNPVVPQFAPPTPERTMDEAHQQAAVDLHKAAKGTLSYERAEALVKQYGRFAVTDVVNTLAERGEKVSNPAGFATKLLASRYGHTLTDGLDRNEVMLAESLYLTVKWISPQRPMRWNKCCELVREFGESALQQLISSMQDYQPGELDNAAGFVLKRLRQGQLEKIDFETHDDAIKSLLHHTRHQKPEHALSRKRATELVKTYGVALVKRALNVLKSRTNIQNPAGFVIVFLQSEAAGKEKKAHVTAS